MNFISRCIQLVKRFDSRFLFQGPQIVLPAILSEFLSSNPLNIGDVGAAGGVDARWRPLLKYCRFLTFDPQPDNCKAEPNTRNYPICLGANKERRSLHLTAFSQCSSIYEINVNRIQDFAVAECFKVIQVAQVHLDTLDNCLSTDPSWTPDFLKIDVEGAELDVLRGGEQSLKRIMGLRVEVNFLQRHKNAPLFGEVDEFLRGHGFELFALTRELMMRRNQLHTPLSQPQLVWGDSIYFLSKASVLQRLSESDGKEREAFLAKFIIILLSHRVHDYAIEIIEEAARQQFIAETFSVTLKQMVRSSAGGMTSWLLNALGGVLLASLIYLVSFPSKHARRSATFYLKERAGFLFYYFWRITARGGEHNASISDPLL